MKKFTLILISIFLLISMAACDQANTPTQPTDTDPAEVVTITGIVQDINDNAILIKNDSGEYWVSMSDEIKDKLRMSLNFDDEVLVSFDGLVMESYPMQIKNVYDIKITVNAEDDDVYEPTESISAER